MSEQKQTVWVVMGNDYPDAVFASEEAADKYCEDKKAENKKNTGGGWEGPRIYYRSYKFEVRT